MTEIAIMGYGTIGSGVYEVVETNSDIIRKNAGDALHVKYVLDLRNFPGQPVEKVLVHDVSVILDDPEVKVVVETMGGVEPAYTFVSKALAAGKSVATSNKELVAKKGAELMALARETHVNFFFEASVGGGIPIIRPLLTCLTADDIEEVNGILNGTTNYILTKMEREGTSFEAALKEAQDCGFAEKKPEADVEGYDACRKIAILLSLVLGKRVDFEDIYTEGITRITREDFAYAKALGGWKIKLLADGWKEGDKVYAMVAPFLVRPEHLLYAVNDVFNGIMVHGNMVDDLMFYGRGAGKEATASAVTADVVMAVKNPGVTVYEGWSSEKQELADIGDTDHQYLARVAEKDAARFEEEFPGALKINAKVEGECGYLTPVLPERTFVQKAARAGVKHSLRVQM